MVLSQYYIDIITVYSWICMFYEMSKDNHRYSLIEQ